MTDPEKATIGDLFRLMTEMRSENAEMRADLSSVKSTVEDHTDRLDGIDAKLDTAAAERQAIRQTVDSLPTFEQVVTVEHGVASLQSDSKAVRSEVRKLATRMDRAGIPAE